MKKILVSFMLMCVMSIAHAQKFPKNANKTDAKGLRQGTWTILYDKDWKIITDEKTTEFYRIITYKDDKPTGIVKDHYKNGTVQMEATLLTDRPEDVMDGLVIIYDAQGKKEKEFIYKNGKQESGKTFTNENSSKALSEKAIELYQAGKYQEAIPIFEKAKIQAEKEYGKEHPEYASSCGNLALLYEKQGLYTKAEPLYIEAKNIYEKVLGKEDPSYAGSCNNLAGLYNLNFGHNFLIFC